MMKGEGSLLDYVSVVVEHFGVLEWIHCLIQEEVGVVDLEAQRENPCQAEIGTVADQGVAVPRFHQGV